MKQTTQPQTFSKTYRIAAPLLATAVMLVSLPATKAQSTPESNEVVRRYIPAGELDAVMASDHPGAFLPITEFETLLQEARKNLETAPQLPAQPALQQADYDAVIEGDRLRITCRLLVRTFHRGWQTISLKVGGLGVLSASVGEGDAAVAAPMARNPENPDELILFLTESGTQGITLEMTAPLTAVGSDQSVAFSLSGAPAGALRLTLPPGKRIAVDGTVLERPAAIDQPADYSIPVGGRSQIQLTITERRDAERVDAVTFASTAIGIMASPGEATWSARTRLSVFGRPIDTLECEVPTKLEITTVESPGLASWTLGDAGEGRTRITLTWRQPFDGVRAIELRGVFSPAEDGHWSAPNLTLNNITAHTGVLILRRPPGIRLQILQSTGLRQTSVEDAQLRLENGDLAADGATSLFFQIWQENFTLEFVPADKEREVQAAMTTLLSLDSQGADLLTTVDVETRFAPLFDVDIDLPAAWEIMTVTVAGQPVDWRLVPHEAGRNRVRVALVPPLNPGEHRQVTLTAHNEPDGWPVETEAIRIQLPEVRLPQASAVEALYGVTADDDLDLAPIDVVGLDPARQSDMEALNRQLANFQRTARLGFTYQDTVFQGQLEVSRMAARLAATCVTLTRIEPEAVLSHVEAQLIIGGGGLREIILTLPEAVGRGIRFRLSPYMPVPVFGPVPERQQEIVIAQLPNIIEQQPGEAVNGVIPWTIKLDRYARGSFVIIGELSQSRTPAADGQPERISVPTLSVPGAEPESGAIGIEASDDQHILVETTGANGRPLDPVDPIDFPPAHTRPKERLVATFRYDRPGWSVTVTENRLDRTPLPSAIIYSLALQSLMDASGLQQTQADADVAAVGVQSLRVELPEGQVLWSAAVDGVPVEVRRDGEAFTVPLSPVDPPEKHRALRLVYGTDRNNEIDSSVGLLGQVSLRAKPPVFSVVTGQGEPQPLETLSSTWTVHHPDHLDLVRSRGAFHSTEKIERDSLIHGLLDVFQRPSAARVLARSSWVAVVLVLIALLGFIRRSSPGSGLRVLLVGLLIVGATAVLVMSASRQSVRSIAITTVTRNERIALPAGGTISAHELFEKTQVQSSPAFDAPAEGKSGHMADSDSQSFPFPTYAPGDAASEFRSRLEDRESVERSDPAGQATPQPGLDAAQAGEPAPETPPLAQQPASATSSIPQIETPALRRPAMAGLLSVAFAMQPPVETVSDEFRTISAPDPSVDALNAQFVDHETKTATVLLIALVVAFLGWWLRSSPRRTKALYLAMTLVLPIALRNLAAAAWLPVLDGVWLGGILTAILWLIHAIATYFATWLSRRKPASVSSASVKTALALAISALMTSAASAQDAQPPAASVFVPYENSDDPLAAKNVFVPQELFLKLWTAAHPDQDPPTPAPRDGIVSAASFVVETTKLTQPSGTAAGSTAPVQGRIVLHSFRTTPIRLPLPIANAALRSAKLNGETAVIEADANGAYQVLVPAKGISILDVEFDLPVETTGPAGRVTWRNAPIAAGRVTVQLPADGLEARVNSDRATTTAADGAAVIEVAIDRGGEQVISWQPPTESGNDNAVQLQTVAVAAIDDAGLSLKSTYSLRVRQGTQSEIQFSLPAGLNLKKIDGADVGGWSVEGEDDARTLTVSFLRKIDAQTQFSIEVFQPVEVRDETVTLTIVPLAPKNVARESGRLGVFTEPHFAVRPGEAVGLTREAADQFAIPMDSGKPAATMSLQYAWRFSQRPVSLQLIVERRKPETKASVQHGVLIGRHKQNASSRIQFQIAGAPRSTLSIALPADYLVVDAVCENMVDYFVSTEGGVRTLTLELSQPTTGVVNVTLNGVIPRKAAEMAVTVPVPAPQDVSQQTTSLAIWVDDLYTATMTPPEGWTAIDPASLDETLRSLRPQTLQFAFRSSTGAPVPIQVELQQQAAELSADVLTMIAVGDSSIDYGLTFQWRITRAATDTLTFTTPGWLRGRLDFVGTGIRQVKSAIAPNDRVRWTILLTDPVREQFVLAAAAAVPLPVDGRVVAPDVVFENAAANGFSNLEVQRQFAVMVNLSQKSLSIEDPSAIETIPRDRLPLKVPDHLVQQAMTIAQVQPGRTTAWLIRDSGTVAAVQAIVTAAKLETLVDWSGAWQTKAVYTVRNRGRQYLPLRIPGDGAARILSVLVKGVPARTVSTTIDGVTVQLVPLPPSSSADLSFDVTLQLAGKLSEPLPREASVAPTRLSLPAPSVVAPSISAEYGVSVAQTSWVVTLPDGVEAKIDDDSNLTSHQSDEWGLLAESQLLTQLESEYAEMSRIVADQRASTSRRAQARSNIKYLDQALKGLVVITDGSASFKGRASAINTENLARKEDLQRKLSKSLDETVVEENVVGKSDSVLNYSFRQGNFNSISGATSGGGSVSFQNGISSNNFILGNCSEILDLNAIGADVDRDGNSDELFGFQAEAAGASDKISGEQEQSRGGRRILKERVQQQQLAAPAQQGSPMSGMGGMGGGGFGDFGSNRFYRSNLERARDAKDLNDYSNGFITQNIASDGMWFDRNIAGNRPILAIADPISLGFAAPISAGWTETGGLSLPIDLPSLKGNSYAYSKSGGDPTLILTARSTRTRSVVWGLLEMGLWIIAAIALIRAATNTTRLATVVVILIGVLAAIAFFLLPGDERWVALVVCFVALVFPVLTRRVPASSRTAGSAI